MRRSPSIVPETADRDIYLVLDDFGRRGRSWRETDEDDTDRATVVRALLQGQYNAPVRVIAFNTAEGRSRDVSEEIVCELLQACARDSSDIPAALQDFIDSHRMPWPERLPRKPIDMRPAASKAFMRDLKAFFKEKDPHKRDQIAADQMRSLWEHQRPGERRVNILDVKELFYAMRNHA